MTLSANHRLITIVILFLALVFSFRGVFDPDTGWHLATGRYIAGHQQTPVNDPFSYSLPDHKYIAHSWLSDVIMWVGYTAGGLWCLSLIFGLGTTGAIWLMLSRVDKKVEGLEQLLVLPGVWLATEVAGQRPQVVTLMGLCYLALVLSRWERRKITGSWFNWLKKDGNWMMPVVFLVWANLHGGVVTGLMFLLVGIGVSFLAGIDTGKKFASIKQSLFQTGVAGLSFLASLINPYGFEIYRFANGLFNNPLARKFNSDWLPLLSSLLPASTLGIRLLILFLAVIICCWPGIKRRDKLMTGVFLLLSLYSIRYILILIVYLIPLSLIIITQAKDRLIDKWPALQQWWQPLLLALPVMVLALSWGSYQELVCDYTNQDCYQKSAQLPVKAVEYIKNNQVPENIFDFYTWGGYLDWQLPDHKVFIDGRMDNFFVNGKSFLGEFVAVNQMQPGWYEKMMSYRTQAALLPNNWKVVGELKGRHGWQEVYRDEMAVVLVAP
jgi:hypothetical protein